MATASISGLASGLDTATIIEQLMQLEAAPQTRLKARVTSEQSAVDAMQGLNAKLAALTTQTAGMSDHSGWAVFTTGSSNPKVTVTATSAARPASFSVQVDQTALAHRLEFTAPVGLTAAGTVPTSVRVDRLDGTAPQDLTTDGTLSGLVDAINDPANKTGLSATAVQVSPGQYRLLVESTATGAAGDFTLTDAATGGPLLGGQTVRAGRDAQITLGSSITITSASNTIKDVAPGVSLTLAPDASGSSDVTVTRDAKTVSGKVKGLVDAVNDILSSIDALTAYDPTNQTTGKLSGESSVRELRGALLDRVFPADGSSLASLGIQTDRSGKLVFDQTAFESAYAADPAAVEARFTTPGTGFVDRLHSLSDRASNSLTGTLTQTITGRKDAIRTLNDDIADWDTRLQLRRDTLTRQYTALEVALGQMNSQSSWLAGQISSLSGGNSQS
jgi:flagellar hook-associated protein 2